jgi:Lsr2
MAERISVEVVDDLDGHTKASERVTLGLNGEFAQLDLNAPHAQELRRIMKTYMKAGVAIDLESFADASRKLDPPSRKHAKKTYNPVIRAWAMKNPEYAEELKQRTNGYIPMHIVHKYEEEMQLDQSA